jgi:hypothetical protein
MKRIIISVIAVLAVCAVPFLIAHPLQAAPPPQHTFIVNDSANPVPVALGGPVSLSGPVSLGGPVSVAGTVLTAPANNPTPVSSIGILSTLSGREARETIYTVPPGKRLIIQSETALTNCAGGVKPEASIIANNSSGGGLFYAMVPQTDRGWWDGQGESFEGSSAVPMFADAGQTVEARIWLNTDVPPGGGIRSEIGFSGYLVDLP